MEGDILRAYKSNCFILQTLNRNLWYFFYSPDGKICYSLYHNKHWGNPITIIKNVNYNFSVNLTSKEDIYVFCQDLSGNVILCLYSNDTWSTKIILENKSSEIYDINFQMLYNSQSLNLIYSMPVVGEKSSQLIYHSMENNKWNSPQVLDNIIPFDNLPFIIQQVNDNLSIAFYEKKGKDCCLGYREFSVALKKWGTFNPFHSTIYTYIDQSFLTTQDTIHALYIIKTGFSYQLIYKNKSSDEWSNSITLYESNKIDKCSIFIIENQLWAIWYINSQLYACISYNFGKTFTKPSRYQGNYNNSAVKAYFITNIKQKEEKLFIREILLYGQPIPQILLIPELYPDFYDIDSNNIDTSKQAETDYLERISILENKISSYEKQVAEKDLQINSLIKEKNLLVQTKKILENQIANQSLELLSLQKQIENVDLNSTNSTN